MTEHQCEIRLQFKFWALTFVSGFSFHPSSDTSPSADASPPVSPLSETSSCGACLRQVFSALCRALSCDFSFCRLALDSSGSVAICETSTSLMVCTISGGMRVGMSFRSHLSIASVATLSTRLSTAIYNLSASGFPGMKEQRLTE